MGVGKLKNEFSYVCPKVGGFAGDRLGIARCEGGPGDPLIIRSPKLQKRARDTEGPKMGVPKITPLIFFWIWGHLPMGPNWGCKKHPPM